MNFTTTWVWVVALLGGIGGPTVALWWIFVRTPRSPRQYVSTAWRDEQLRGRRE